MPSPTFPHLPTAQGFHTLDIIFTSAWITEWLLRGFVAESFIKARSSNDALPFLWDPLTWCDFLAILPTVFCQFNYWEDFATFKAILLLRCLKGLKLLRRFVGVDIIFETIRRSTRQLAGPTLIMGSLVLILGGAMFYLEPCVDMTTCPFTNIFDAAFYTLSTITTVGYARGVPVGFYDSLIGIFVLWLSGIYIAIVTMISSKHFAEAWSERAKFHRRLSPPTAKRQAWDISDLVTEVPVNEKMEQLRSNYVDAASRIASLERKIQYMVSKPIARTAKDTASTHTALTRAKSAFMSLLDDLRETVQALSRTLNHSPSSSVRDHDDDHNDNDNDVRSSSRKAEVCPTSKGGLGASVSSEAEGGGGGGPSSSCDSPALLVSPASLIESFKFSATFNRSISNTTSSSSSDSNGMDGEGTLMSSSTKFSSSDSASVSSSPLCGPCSQLYSHWQRLTVENRRPVLWSLLHRPKSSKLALLSMG